MAAEMLQWPDLLFVHGIQLMAACPETDFRVTVTCIGDKA